MKLYKIIQINIEIVVVVILLVTSSVQLLGMKGQQAKLSPGARLGTGTLGLKSANSAHSKMHGLKKSKPNANQAYPHSPNTRILLG